MQSELHCPQDVFVEAKFLTRLWQMRKIGTDAVCQDLIRSRSRGAIQQEQVIRKFEEAQLRLDLQEESKRILMKLHAQYERFRRHETVREWLEHVQRLDREEIDRAKPLLFVDDSQTAKTAKAVSLFPLDDILLVNCQGLGDFMLPSIRDVHMKNKKVVIWEEIKHTQVLANKRLFQSGAWVLDLGDSGCHQYAYPILPYKVKHVLCSNYFPRSRAEDKKMSKQEEDYLQKNFFVPQLPPQWKWFLVPEDADVEMTNKFAQEKHAEATMLPQNVVAVAG